MDNPALENENLEKGPWFPLGMRPEQRQVVRTLVLAAKNGEQETVTKILESGDVDVDSKYHWETALMVACQLNNVSLCRTLLDFGADCNVSRIMQQTSLWIAASYGNAEVMELLLSSRKCSQENLDNALRKCVTMDFLHGCDCLLRAGASPDATDPMGFTCLHVASGSSEEMNVPRNDNWKFQNQESWRLYHATKYETCELLIMWQADINCRDNVQGTPLHYACEANNEEICRLLIENGADVNALGGMIEKTPLHAAISKDNPKVMKMLLRHSDIQLNIKDAEGETPLMCAIQMHRQECVKTLLDDERWPKMMSVITRRDVSDETINTPMRELIRQMPDMACYVLSKCIELSSLKDLKNPNFSARLSFAFLDDTYSSTFWNESNSDTMTTDFDGNRLPASRTDLITSPSSTIDQRISIAMRKIHNKTSPFKRKDTIVSHSVRAKTINPIAPPCDKQCFNCMGKLGCRLNKHIKSYTTQNRILMNNHPLKIAMREKRYSVLCHPVATALINHKWHHIGRYWFYGGLMLYLMFVILLNTHIMISYTMTNLTTTIENETVPLLVESFLDTWKPVITVILLCLCVIEIGGLVLTFITGFPDNLLSFENWLQVAVFGTAVATILDLAQSDPRSRDLAAVCMFASWFSMLLTLRQFPVIGIFFIMFTRILKNSFIVLLVFIPVTLGFALTFSIVAPSLPQFSPSKTFPTVLVMLSGEMEYIDSVAGKGSSSIPYKGAATSLYVIFTILMVICLLNLLVGLAVSDVDTLHSQAKAEMMSLKPTDGIGRELAQIRYQLETLTSARRTLKSEDSTQPPKSPTEVPGARALRKTFGIELSRTGNKRLSPLV